MEMDSRIQQPFLCEKWSRRRKRETALSLKERVNGRCTPSHDERQRRKATNCLGLHLVQSQCVYFRVHKNREREEESREEEAGSSQQQGHHHVMEKEEAAKNGCFFSFSVASSSSSSSRNEVVVEEEELRACTFW
ncbi:Protein CBG27120 [Caenorhabditis briggsae]|uniref:Protein CBG27120 n=1 Tax=Caenorhabditis briggsae TaxID=6238 RepID=B6IHJ4_CAEBR|nr:Protein CBG27120 [Caenorhabditis briggsae]CAR99374.1 Protein CBG27120 [Caenorhabditis briggsae]